MKIHGLLIPAAALMILLAGCVNVKPPVPATPSAPYPVMPPSPETASGVLVPQPPPAPGAASGVLPPLLPPAGMAPIEPPQRSSMSKNRAVIALLEQAHANFDAGRHGAADSALERALRIEPRNPWVWEEIAQVRLAQGRYDQAISLARKSNSFAGNGHLVRAINWQLIGKARVAKGDSDGANQAFQQASDLAQQARNEPAPGL